MWRVDRACQSKRSKGDGPEVDGPEVPRRTLSVADIRSVMLYPLVVFRFRRSLVPLQNAALKHGLEVISHHHAVPSCPGAAHDRADDAAQVTGLLPSQPAEGSGAHYLKQRQRGLPWYTSVCVDKACACAGPRSCSLLSEGEVWARPAGRRKLGLRSGDSDGLGEGGSGYRTESREPGAGSRGPGAEN
jgi:hypothetical protein